MGAEIEEFALDRHARLFEEFTPCSREQVFAVIDEALRDRPASCVLLRPERAPWMDEHNLQIRRPPTKQQNACANPSHSREATMRRLFSIGGDEQAPQFDGRVRTAWKLQRRSFAEIARIEIGVRAGGAENTLRPILFEPKVSPLGA